MKKIIRIDEKSIKNAANKIKKQQKINTKHYIILDIIANSFNYKNYKEYLKESNNPNNESIHLDLADIKVIEDQLKEGFKPFCNISTIDFLEREKKEQKHFLNTSSFDFNIVDYIRLYNELNNRNINNGEEIKTYKDIESVLFELIKDIEIRFKNTEEKDTFELNNKNKNKKINSFLFNFIELINSNKKKQAMEELKLEIKNVYINDLLNSKDLFIENIQKFPVYTKNKRDEDMLLKYAQKIDKDIIFLGTESLNINKINLLKKKIFKNDLKFKNKHIGSHFLITGHKTQGSEDLKREYILQAAMMGNGFVYFNEKKHNNNLSIIKNAIHLFGKGKKIINLNVNQFLSLRNEEIKSFVEKNKMVFIDFKDIELINKPLLTKIENKINNFFNILTDTNIKNKNTFFIASNSYMNNILYDFEKSFNLLKNLSKNKITLLYNNTHKPKKITEQEYNEFIQQFYYNILLKEEDYLEEFSFLNRVDKDKNSKNIKFINFNVIKDNRLIDTLYHYKVYK